MLKITTRFYLSDIRHFFFRLSTYVGREPAWLEHEECKQLTAAFPQ